MEDVKEDAVQNNKPFRGYIAILSFVIILLSLALLLFACKKYYVEPAEGFADHLGGLLGKVFWIALVFAIFWRAIPRKKRQGAILFFALIFCVVTLYDSINLLNKASSIKNTVQKFSTVLDDLDSGNLVSNDKIDKSQYGELTGVVELTNDWLSIIQKEIENLFARLEECHYSSMNDQNVLLQCILSSECPFDFDKADIILNQFEATLSNRYDEFELKIKTSNIPVNIKQRFLSSFDKDTSLKGDMKLLGLIRSYIYEVRSFLTFMEENKTDWTFENNRFLFQSDDDYHIYLTHKKNFQQIIEGFASLEKQVDSKVEQTRRDIEHLSN